LNPAMTISEGRITFNTACLKKFGRCGICRILFNSIERCIAVRPCDKDNINAVKWGTIRNGKWAVLPRISTYSTSSNFFKQAVLKVIRPSEIVMAGFNLVEKNCARTISYPDTFQKDIYA